MSQVAENRTSASAVPFPEGTVTMTLDLLNKLLEIAATCKPYTCVRGQACQDHYLDSVSAMMLDVYGKDMSDTLCESDLFAIRDHFAHKVVEAREFARDRMYGYTNDALDDMGF